MSIAHDWRAHFLILMATGTARAFDGVRLNDGVSTTGLVHLRAAGTSLLLDCGGTLPRVLHWGADLGELSDDDIEVTEVAWFPLPDISEQLAYSDERNLLDQASRLLRETA